MIHLTQIHFTQFHSAQRKLFCIRFDNILLTFFHIQEMIILHELTINLHDGKTMHRSDTLCITMMLENKTLF